MLNEALDAIESVLEGLDVGGEQSRQFAEEIKLLRQVIGCPETPVSYTHLRAHET